MINNTCRYTKEQVDALAREIKESRQRVVVYGFCRACEMVIAGMFEYGINADAIYDRDPKKVALKSMYGVPVKLAGELYNEPKGTYIFIAVRGDGLKLKEGFIQAGYNSTYTGLPFVDLFDFTKYSTNVHRLEFDPQSAGDIGETMTHIRQTEFRKTNKYHNNRLTSLEDLILHEPFDIYRDIQAAFRNLYDIENGKPTRSITTLVIAFGRKCNLRCVDCGADIQYTDRDISYSAESIDASLNRLFNFIESVATVYIGGGEPFTGDNLLEIVKVVYKYKEQGKVNEIMLVTNGGIIPKEGVLTELKNYIDVIKVSDYNGLVKNREKFIIEARKCLPANRVIGEYEVDRDGILHEVETLWSDTGDFTFRNRTDEQLQALSEKCTQRKTMVLCGGKLYNCWRSVSCMSFGIIPSNASECADLLNTELTDEEMSKSVDSVTNIFKVSIPPLSACNYCDGMYTTDKRVPAGIQADHKLSLYEKTENPSIRSPQYDVKTYLKERVYEDHII